MSEFHDDYPSYETMYNHSEEEGKKARKVLWKVFWVMLFITIFELIVGSMAPSHGWSGTLGLKVLFIGLTVVKAAAIVLWFMHLGHETKFFKYIILLPYITFILYAVFIILVEGVYSGYPRNMTRVDKIFIDQQEKLKAGHHGGGGAAHEAEAPHGEEHH
ncbi:MAG: cytochrome C oxidase subunit IV family protein [Bacteroidota bacterium]|nr:cytochrome C oxidase subunit IV family protein [Bacteroidota bacterium]MDP3147226.1 cytochrome C oxidase subunit IV family protein [Bacteroidota bacterium]MDP3557700.1 cytochrome C oxidase subunit IV family protein [Bacteroidota bacterium]